MNQRWCNECEEMHDVLPNGTMISPLVQTPKEALSSYPFGKLQTHDVATANLIWCPECEGWLKAREPGIEGLKRGDPSCDHRNAYFYVLRTT